MAMDRQFTSFLCEGLIFVHGIGHKPGIRDRVGQALRLYRCGVNCAAQYADKVWTRNTMGHFNRMPFTQWDTPVNISNLIVTFSVKTRFCILNLWQCTAELSFALPIIASMCLTITKSMQVKHVISNQHIVQHIGLQQHLLRSQTAVSTCTVLGMVHHQWLLIVFNNLKGWFERHAGNEWVSGSRQRKKTVI